MDPVVAGLLAGLLAGVGGNVVIVIASRGKDKATQDKTAVEAAEMVMNRMHTQMDDMSRQIEHLVKSDRECRRRVSFLLGIVDDQGIPVPDDIRFH